MYLVVQFGLVGSAYRPSTARIDGARWRHLRACGANADARPMVRPSIASLRCNRPLASGNVPTSADDPLQLIREIDLRSDSGARCHESVRTYVSVDWWLTGSPST